MTYFWNLIRSGCSPSRLARKARLNNRQLNGLPFALSLWISTGLLPTSLLATPVLSTPVVQLAQHTEVNPGGTQLSVNGQPFTTQWIQWTDATGQPHLGISDMGVMKALGLELLDTNDPNWQPVRWFSDPDIDPLKLPVQLTQQYRYLDITALATRAGWQWTTQGSLLKITTPSATIQAIRQGRQPWGQRLVIDLTQPTPWQVTQDNNQLKILLQAAIPPDLLKQFQSTPLSITKDALRHQASPQVESSNGQTILSLVVDEEVPQAFTLTNPPRLVVDVTRNPTTQRNILWAKGLRWRQQTLVVGNKAIPVTWLEIDPKQPGLSLRPVWANPKSMLGIEPLLTIARQSQATAMINGGFFNRKNQSPLGALRLNGQWLSGPILNRGAIAWTDQGQVQIGRLSLEQTLSTSTGQQIPILFSNSGYFRAGLSLYTPDWGSIYQPLMDGETLVLVEQNRVVEQRSGGAAGTTTTPIPANGYLLVVRANQAVAKALAVGTNLTIGSRTVPASFEQYPHILGAGPVLLQNRQIVLNATDEQFSKAFAQQSAWRSAIGTTEQGHLLIVSLQNEVGGNGPTLLEAAKLMQQLGAVDALNLDGGSSTTLYLGGHLVDRPPQNAARVHNGLGIFIQP